VGQTVRLPHANQKNALSGARGYRQLGPDFIPLPQFRIACQYVKPVEENNSVEVVRLVLDDAGQ
jgi:hypothetical protein